MRDPYRGTILESVFSPSRRGGVFVWEMLSQMKSARARMMARPYRKLSDVRDLAILLAEKEAIMDRDRLAEKEAQTDCGPGGEGGRWNIEDTRLHRAAMEFARQARGSYSIDDADEMGGQICESIGYALVCLRILNQTLLDLYTDPQGDPMAYDLMLGMRAEQQLGLDRLYGALGKHQRSMMAGIRLRLAMDKESGSLGGAAAGVSLDDWDDED